MLSGIGTLTCEAAISPAVGEVALACAYELEDQVSSLVQLNGHSRFAPDQRRPVLVAGRDRFESLLVDLRQVRTVRRLLLVVYSFSREPLTWAGTLIISTHGGARVEVPLDDLGTTPVGVAVALYQLDGELVIRSVLRPAATVREACVSYGYDAITWLDDRTPLV